jgi:ATP-dependent RNA helicase SUPV3L1/SUV3
MRSLAEGRRLTAVLGPTNTGKTYLAIERMVGHGSGMIGFPLRLLARENYDRVVQLKGVQNVALITGEERIVPAAARYFVCTVESMPVDRPVGFLAVDEIQLAADPERGHVFTERLLRARGLDETMFMGAETIKPVLRRLVPGIEIISRTRFSTLLYGGTKKLTRLPRRGAVVAFSANDVYAVADLVRRQRGGTAVVMGALSPRARNAQVGLYQSGEVDYLVATDAIGMGLNMDLDHVHFASLVKFDGRGPRRLSAPELAQIAGRAGRHMNDGRFGTTAEAGPLDPELVEAIENHRFDPLAAVWWRNPDLSFRSVDDLRRSLDRPPPRPELLRKRDADDHRALDALAAEAEIRKLAQGIPRVRLLWEVCQIPDFRKIMSDSHTRLLGRIFTHLCEPPGRLPTDWVARQIERLDETEGDIDRLTQRIAHIRTWTYVSHRADWLDDSRGWQERARAIEDKLSDALHERLTQRFVDRRAAQLTRRLGEGGELLAAVTAGGEVLVEGHHVGWLEGLRFRLDVGSDSVSLAQAARRALPAELARRVARLVADPDEAFALRPDGAILWQGAPVARLAAGRGPLAPSAILPPDELLTTAQRDQAQRRLETWLESHLGRRLEALARFGGSGLTGAARGLGFQLVERLGTLPRAEVTALVDALTDEDRKRLARLGLRIGTETLFVPALLKPAAQALRALLWAAGKGLPAPPPVPAPGRISQPLDAAFTAEAARAVGFLPLGPLAVRADMAERLAAAARAKAREGAFPASAELAQLAGCRPEELGPVLAALGYRMREGGEAGEVVAEPRRRRAATATPRGHRADSPFAALARLHRR